MSRYLLPLLCCALSSAAVAESDPPGTAAFNQYAQASWDVQESSRQLFSMMDEKSPDKAKAKLVGDSLLENKKNAERYLAQSIEQGNAAALFYKARIVEFANPDNLDLAKKRETACALYGESAQKGLLVAAVVYAKCSDTVPKTPRTEESRALLRSALNNVLKNGDAYQDFYPFGVTHAYCFERPVEPPREGENPLERMRALAQPTMLDAGQARAEAFYYLAADYSSPVSRQSQDDLQRAFEAGCQTDGLRLKRTLPKAD